jgi:mono/diheme cytochrome c family protein
MLYLRTSDLYYTNVVCKNDGTDRFVDMEYGNFCGAAGYFATPAPGSPDDAGLARRASSAPRPPSAPSSKLGPIPLTKPPYAHLVAIDLNKGDIAWKVPFGEGSPAVRNHRLLKGVALPERLGTQGRTGLLITASSLIFIGGDDPYLYAFDKVTGRELWRGRTPFRTSGNPMTYRARNGRQYVVIGTGGGPDATVVAFAIGTNINENERHIRTTASARGTPERRDADSGTLVSGEASYANVCQACHGPQGQGASAPALVPMTKEPDEVLGIVREGFRQMPPVSSQELGDDQVGRILGYLRSLTPGTR